MKPLKLTPAYKDYIWGGEKLRTIYGKETDLTPVAESWELSCHKDGLSVIGGGEYDGMTLDEYIKENPSSLGTSVTGGELPILIKFIDAADNLSVQVHPDDEKAREWEGQNGKTEMWYVVDTEEDARIVYGLKEAVSRDALAEAIEEKRLETLLNSVPSKKGDVFFVEAGTIHAICKGNIIAEIQQNSNVTYRLYDYGRVGKDGKERELHIEKGVMSATCTKPAPYRITEEGDGIRLIGACDYFLVREIVLRGEKIFFADEKSYNAIVVVDGSINLYGEDFEMPVSKGETIFIPAENGEYSVKGTGTFLLVSNPVQ